MKKFILVIPSSLILFGCSNSSGVDSDSIAANRSAVDDDKTQASSISVTDKTLRIRQSAKLDVPQAEPLDNVAQKHNPPENQRIEKVHESREPGNSGVDEHTGGVENDKVRLSSEHSQVPNSTRASGDAVETVVAPAIDAIDLDGTPSAGIHGFHNMRDRGNRQNCYFTSIIQALFHTRTFYNRLVVNDDEVVGITEAARNVLVESRALAREMWNTPGHEALHVEGVLNGMRRYVVNRNARLFVVGRANQAQDAMTEYLSSLAQSGIGNLFQIHSGAASSGRPLDLLKLEWFEFDGSQESITNRMIAERVRGLSPILIIEASRMGEIPENLDLSNVTGNQADHYRLVGQVIYTEGHYISQFRHHVTNRWVRIDDEIIQNRQNFSFAPHTLTHMVFERIIL